MPSGGQKVDPHYSSRNALSVMMTRIRSPGDAPMSILPQSCDPQEQALLRESIRLAFVAAPRFGLPMQWSDHK